MDKYVIAAGLLLLALAIALFIGIALAGDSGDSAQNGNAGNTGVSASDEVANGAQPTILASGRRPPAFPTD